MSIEIATLLKNSAPLNGAEYINICDADGNGKLEGEELSVWEQLNSSFRASAYGQKEFDKFYIGGVLMHGGNAIKSAKKEGEHYTVTCGNGVTVEYDSQENKNEVWAEKHPGEFHQVPGSCAEIFSANKKDDGSTYTDLRGFKGNGVKLTGTDANDSFTLYSTNFTSIDGGKGTDTVSLSNSSGVAQNNGKAPIKAEKAKFTHGSKNFSVKSEGEKVENLNEKKNVQHTKYLQQEEEKEKQGFMSASWIEKREIDIYQNHGCTNYELL